MAAKSLSSSSSAKIFFSSPSIFKSLPSLSGKTSQKFSHHRLDGRTLKSTARCGMRSSSRRSSESDDGTGGRVVDENMIVLRKRIHETKMIESNYDEPPSEWMDWEKRFYAGGYDSLICEAVGILQARLMDTRPGVALVLVALVTFSVPTTTLLGIFRLLQLIGEILAPNS